VRVVVSKPRKGDLDSDNTVHPQVDFEGEDDGFFAFPSDEEEVEDSDTEDWDTEGEDSDSSLTAQSTVKLSPFNSESDKKNFSAGLPGLHGVHELSACRAELDSIFVNNTISEDRSGDQGSVMSGRLAALCLCSDSELSMPTNDSNTSHTRLQAFSAASSPDFASGSSSSRSNGRNADHDFRQATEPNIRRLLEKYANVERCNFMVHTGDSCGFGFVKMASAEQADTAMEAQEGQSSRVKSCTWISLEEAVQVTNSGQVLRPPKRDLHLRSRKRFRVRRL